MDEPRQPHWTHLTCTFPQWMLDSSQLASLKAKEFFADRFGKRKKKRGVVLVLKYVSFTIKSSSLCFYLRWNGCALIIKLQESGKQKEINFWWNKHCSGFPHRTPIAVIEEMKYLLQFPQIITLRRFTWPIENCTPLCTPHIPALYRTTSADSIPVITLEWRDFVGSPGAWFYPALSGLSLVYAEWVDRGVSLLGVTSGASWLPNKACGEVTSQDWRRWVPQSLAVLPICRRNTHPYHSARLPLSSLYPLQADPATVSEHWWEYQSPNRDFLLNKNPSLQGREAPVSGARWACLI